jgi:hypothetical protein
MSETPKDDKKNPPLVQSDDAPVSAIEDFVTRSIANMIALIPPDEVTKDPEKLDALARATAVLIKAIEKHVHDHDKELEEEATKTKRKKSRADKGGKDLKSTEQPIPLFFRPFLQKYDPQQTVGKLGKLTIISRTPEATPEGQSNKVGRKRKKSNHAE